VLAFVATALAGINRGKTMVLERKFRQISDTQKVTETQVKVLKEIESLLNRMDGGGRETDASGPTRQDLKARIDVLEEKVGKLEKRLSSSQER
jgi:hypothetical protein